MYPYPLGPFKGYRKMYRETLIVAALSGAATKSGRPSAIAKKAIAIANAIMVDFDEKNPIVENYYVEVSEKVLKAKTPYRVISKANPSNDMHDDYFPTMDAAKKECERRNNQDYLNS